MMLVMESVSDNEAITAVFGMFFGLGAPLAALIVFLSMRHRERVLMYQERIEMIRQGMVPADNGRVWRGRGAANAPRVEDDSITLRKGIRLAAIGFAITLCLGTLCFHDGEFRPGPWLLPGMIPLCIGLAQVTIAVLSGERLRPHIPRSSVGPADDTLAYDRPSPFRPGATPDFQPPAGPPQRR